MDLHSPFLAPRTDRLETVVSVVRDLVRDIESKQPELLGQYFLRLQAALHHLDELKERDH